jgi:cytochrome c2
MRLAVLISVALLASADLAAAPAAAQDIATGQILFNQRCSICHSLTRQSRKTTVVPLQRPEDMLNDPDKPGTVRSRPGETTTISALRQGPDLSGLLNLRQPGSLPNYAYVHDYSDYGPEWTATTLDAWIDKHDDGKTEAAARADIIAYLSTLRSQ